MPKNIVVFCDGTGNQIGRNLSNVLKLFRITIKDARQLVYYGSGIGTIGASDEWTRMKQDALSVFALTTGFGLGPDILGAYAHICRHYAKGDAIFLFGFSRGAYTVRALAGLIHMVGILPPNQLNISNYALRAYKQASGRADDAAGASKMLDAFKFGRIAGARRARIKFMGVWDTVASILVPRGDRIVPQLLTLPYTRRNPSVEVFRHAMAIDERRRMFRLNRWAGGQTYTVNPFSTPPQTELQDTKQVWFAGVHSDIGGGYPENESALSKYPLNWMIDEAVLHGLRINPALRKYYASGQPRAGWPNDVVAPHPEGALHNSMTRAWRTLEWLPKAATLREWPSRRCFLGRYLPNCEPRRVETDEEPVPTLHASVILRRESATGYAPENFPSQFRTEP